MRGGCAGGIALALVACAGPPPSPPTAVVDLRPGAICAGDDYATPIVISGARSSSALSLVPAPPDPGAAPLTYRWDLRGDAFALDAGSLDGPELTVRVLGERPLHASLTVIDEDGGEATSLATLGLVVPLAPPCDEGCAMDTECVEGRCLPQGACADETECPACFVCEEARCVPEARP